jgi:acetamidase/formamidase
VHWGYFDARLAPRLTVESGESVTISSVSGSPELMPVPPLKVPPALPAIHQKVPRQMGPHILTGPVAIQGAQPGHVLQVDIEAIELNYDWGYNTIPSPALCRTILPKTATSTSCSTARASAGGCPGARRFRWRRSSA